MTYNPPLLLLDTNVWLDLFLPHRPNRRTVLDLLSAAETHEASLAYPSCAILDVYQKVRSDNKRWIRSSRELTELDALAIKRMAWDYVNLMRRKATAVPVDTNDVALACSFRDTHDDLEDDLILAACQRAGADYLVTTDAALIAHAPVEAVTPARMLELLRSGSAKGAPTSHESPSTTDWLYRWLAQYGTSEGRS
ncbi:MAG: type II toxin-antitoxin system VapC family toxin [Coriobacteriales bacterium]|nr:type II toxin-antitoxin system VapC family toxin [Coriobacteriales bacterium]